MKVQAANRMKEFEEGIFQVLNEKKNELLQQGRTVYNLSVGTPDFPPAKHIIDAVVEAAKKPENYKYALADLKELTLAVQKRFQTRYGVQLLEDEIMSVYGSQEGMSHIGLSILNENDIVLVPNPGYPVFSVGPFLAGAQIKTYDLLPENNYLPDLEAIGNVFGKNADSKNRAKMMIVSYPLNPICKCADKNFYEKLIAWAKENEIIIVHDNAYSDIVYDGKKGISILAVDGAKEVAVEFYSLSKSFNYTGARSGFLVGNKEVIRNFKKLRSQIDYGTFLPVQYGAIAALTGSDESVILQCKEYEARRNALCDGLTEIGWKVERSEGTMFAWGKIPDKFGTDDVKFVMELMEQTGVLCTPGSSFGSNGCGYVRFALTMPVQLINNAVNAIKDSGILY